MEAANKRRREAYRPGTWANFSSIYKNLANFCDGHGLDPADLSTAEFCAYVEALAESGLSLGTIQNYISALKTMFRMRSVNAHLFKDVMWEMTAKALLKTVRTKPPRRAAMDWEDLEKLVRHCMTSETLQVLRLALVVGFLAFLRASNLAPRTVATFDPSRHSTLADIIPRGGSLLFHLRWTKTLQRTGQDVYIPLAPLKGSVLDPKAAWRDYVQALPPAVTARDPLLLTTGRSAPSPVTLPVLRAMLREALSATSLEDHGYTLHSLRRGRAAHAHRAGVPLQDIKRHGTWKSQAVDLYLGSLPPRFSSVVECFQQTAASSTAAP